ncbi:MAG: ribosomal RNA small subunit methyltransferase A [Candidatus Thorarchaeota archaeon]|nr:ribosomal RNA small subunit methyltransferase A [Candidatus Thorarchaeota archaeon]
MSFLHSASIASTLRKYGVTPRKKYGQSFLTDVTVAQRMVDAAALAAKDRVLEIGGGLGMLTQQIAPAVEHLYVVEIDEGLVRALKDRFRNTPSVEIILGDALRVDLPQVNKVISNLPYSISSEVTFRILNEIDFELAILMYQREFADRILAKPGSREYSRLSIDVQYLAVAESVTSVPATKFYPKPAVDSTVLKLTKRRDGPLARNRATFYQLVHAIYSYPNKQLRKSLGIWFTNLGLDRELADTVISRCKKRFHGEERIRTLTLEDLVTLADEVSQMIDEGLLPQLE